TSDQAWDLSKRFHDLATAVGNYRFAHWDDLTKQQREKLKDSQITLLNNSSHFVTEAIGLELDDAQGGLKSLEDVTTKAQNVLENITDVKKGVEITACLVKLGAAVASENPAVIASAAQAVATSVAA